MLEVKGLKKSFGKNLVLRGIDLKVNKGDRIAIIGPSGCGKSTFLRCLNGIERLTGGSVILNGINIFDGSIELPIIRRKIGMVFQQFNLFPHLTVLDNIMLAPIKLGILKEEEAKKEALKLLDTIGLKDRANYYPDELSGGQKQRVVRILYTHGIITYKRLITLINKEKEVYYVIR